MLRVRADGSMARSARLIPDSSARGSNGAAAAMLLLSASVLLAVLASVFLAGAILRNGVTPDYPWLRAAGAWMLEHGRLPQTDLFSWSAAERPWLLHQWGFEIAVAGIDRLGGHAAVAMVFAWAALAIYLVVPLRAANRRAPAVLVAAVGAAALAILSVELSIRPVIATAAGLLLQHLLTDRLRRGGIGMALALLACAALYAIWASLHTGFALGLSALLLTLAGDWMESRSEDAPEQPTPWPAPLRPLKSGALLGAAAVGSLATPYGPRLHLHLADLTAQSALNGRVDGLGSPDFGLFQFQLLLALLLLLVAALIRRPGALRPADLLHLAAFTLATFLAACFIVWTALYLVLLLPAALARAWPGLARHCPTRADRPMWLTLAAVAAFAPPLLAARGMADPVGHSCARFSAAIEAYVAQRGADERLLTDPVSGSCIIAAAPGTRVFFDTRFDFYGAAFSVAALDALALRPGWRELIQAQRIEAALLDRKRPLAEALAADPRFTILFRNEEAVVVRRLH
jgi:hypothetical protein